MRRGLQVLHVIAQEPDGLLVSQLADSLGTHRAGIYRLLGPLSETRLIRRTAEGRYVLGAGLIELASRVEFPLLKIAGVQLQRLADDIGATTALTLQEENEAVVALVLEPRTADMHIAYRPGLRHPLSVAAPGIALLAGSPPIEGERKEVSTARRRGYAWSQSELLPGTTGVATAISAPQLSVPAAISAVWADKRNVDAMKDPLVECAQRIGKELGKLDVVPPGQLAPGAELPRHEAASGG